MKRFLFLIIFIAIFTALVSSPQKAMADEKAESFAIDFLDVGQGDAVLIECDGHYMLVDGGSPKASRIVYTVLKERNIKNLDYVVSTHPDSDHVGGLPAAVRFAKVGTAYSPVTEGDTRAFKSFVRYLKRQGKEITVPEAGNTFELGDARVEVLGPVSGNEAEDINNMSIVLRVVYGRTSFILMGDAELEEEKSIIDTRKILKSDVIKIGHHGSDGSTSDDLLRAVSPKYAVISVGDDNTYGHPTEIVLDKLEKKKIKTYRTDLDGDIRIISDGRKIEVSTEKDRSLSGEKTGSEKTEEATTAVPVVAPAPAAASEDASVKSEDATEMTYILNTNTGTFHYPDCKSVKKMKEKNKQVFTGTREEALAMGYHSCGNCRP